MEENLKVSLKIVAEHINGYVKTKEIAEIEKIEKVLEEFLDVQTAKLWRFDDASQMLYLMDTADATKTPLEAGVTKQAITQRGSVIDNHITSNKYYVPQIDNSLELKIKSMIVFPLFREKRTVGILRVWRGVKHKKVFTKQDENTLKNFEPLLLLLMENKEVNKEILLELLGERREEKPKNELKVAKDSRPIKESESISAKNIASNMDQNLQLEIAYEALKKEHEANLSALELQQKRLNESEAYQQELFTLQEKYKAIESKLTDDEGKSKEILFLKATLKQYEERERALKDELQEGTESLKLLEAAYEKEEKKSQESLKNELALLKSEFDALKSENKELKEEKSNSSKSIQTLKAEMSLASQSSSFQGLDENIERIFQDVDNIFGENEHNYMLFEMLIYALHSKKGLSFIEDKIRNSKVLLSIIDEYYFKAEIEVHNEKSIISDIVKHVQSYKKSIFSDACTLDVTVDSEMPVSLVFDAPKIQSVIFHLLTDLYQFIDYSQSITVDMSYRDKILQIALGGSTHQQNSLFKSIFKQMKIGGDEKERLGLMMSRKIIERLKGVLNIDYSDTHYTFILSIPVQVVKM